MRADGARGEGQGVTLEDDVEGIGVAALLAGTKIAGDVLLDGAVLAAGSREAVNERQLMANVTLGRGLDGLAVAGVGKGIVHNGGNLGGIDAREGLLVDACKGLVDLAKVLVATGLEERGCHRDGPDACVDKRAHVEGVRATGEGDAQAAVELVGDALGERNGERIERAARHVHLVAGQLGASDVHGEGVGELNAKLHATIRRQGNEALEHGHGIGPLQVLVEVVLVEDDVVKAQRVQGLASVLVAQERGVALDVGVQALLGDEVGGNALNLGRRAAMERGLGDRAGDARRDGVDKGGVHVLEAVEIGLSPGNGLLEDGSVGGVLHVVDVGVDLLALNALEVVANRHVEDEAVRVAEAKLAGEELAGNPGLDVLVEGVGHGELG